MQNLQEKFERFLVEEPFDKGQSHGFARVGAPGGVPAIDDVVAGDVFNIAKPESIQKINGYLAACSATPVINPYFLVKRIQDKLSQIGLQFDTPNIVDTHGSTSKKIKQYGDVTGYKPDAPKDNQYGFPKVISPDTVSGTGVEIKFDWVCVKGLYTVDAQLVGVKTAPATIGEDKTLDEVSPPGWSGTTKAMKKEKGISNPFALSWYMKNKGAKSHVKPE